ncbi:S8 family serine peptidase [Thermonema rossianum]|uniref:S8 family serine peptidase n=1 Tax=Thermonema rossianum TaxID=55505 RepID=UPI00068D69C8|nr:S8 family serine peptidase [Thermonema rossianum]
MKKFLKNIYRLWILCAIFVGQTQAQQQTNKERLLELAQQYTQLHEAARQRVAQYAAAKGVSTRVELPNGKIIEIVDVTPDGQPVYRETKNVGAAATIGTNQLHPGGSLGLSLTGKGMVVGVWDGGNVRATHQEFGGRVQAAGDGTALSAHATHVTGTMIAAGVDPSAKGMAPEAVAHTYYWNNDLAEMAQEAANELLVSNHSYGTVQGWYWNGSGWEWTGGAGNEDPDFGAYTSESKAIDNVAYNAPYYLICWAAGNDFGDGNGGPGPQPPDGAIDNGDCIGPEGMAKNILAVGAVEKVTNYTDPSSVKLASFSSRGPADDGRIKPDIVAAGVSVYSTVSSADDAYGTMSGTSMATPNLSGSLILLQQLYYQLHGQYMRAATLKGLVIQTAKEAGPNPGPDHWYGWGLADIEHAARVIWNENGQNIRIVEAALNNGDTYSFTFYTDATAPVVLTLCWTDVPGTNLSTGLDDPTPALVNDLDVVITDASNNQYFPWIGPATPTGPATKGVNNVDNVEKIEFTPSAPGNYTVTVSHKGTLIAAPQAFSIILEAPDASAPASVLYWKGGSGDLADPANWATAPDGTGSAMPDATKRLVFGANAFSGNGNTLTLSQDLNAAQIYWAASGTQQLDLQGKRFTVKGSVLINEGKLNISGTGYIDLGTNSGDLIANLNESDWSKAVVSVWMVDPNTKADFQNVASIGTLTIYQGEVDLSDEEFSVDNIYPSGTLQKKLILTNATLTFAQNIDLNDANLSVVSDGARLNALSGTASSLSLNNENYDFDITVDNTTTLSVDGTDGATLKRLTLNNGTLGLNNDIGIHQLTAMPGTIIQIATGKTLSIGTGSAITGDASGTVVLAGVGGSATLTSIGTMKLCASYLTVSDVDVVEPLVATATQSTLTNANGWLEQGCDEVLFADFTAQYSCVADGTTFFNNQSTGTIQTYLWDFGDGNTSGEPFPTHTYASTGSYVVTLTVSDGTNTHMNSKTIQVNNYNYTSAPYLSYVSGKLYVNGNVGFYRWFKDGVLIPDFTSNGLPVGEYGIGEYYAVVGNTNCAYKTAPLFVNGLAEEVAEGMELYPNPFTGELHIKLMHSWQGQFELSVTDLAGRVYQSYEKSKKSFTFVDTLTPNLPAGMYILTIKSNDFLIHKRIIKQ